jgi:membrane protease YdiL (CAAX protease family)
MQCEIGRAEVETGETLGARTSLFRGVPWRSRDILAGVCLVLLMVGIHYAPSIRLESVSPYVTFPAGTLLVAALLIAYPIWVIYQRAPRPVVVFPGIGRLAKEFLLAMPLTLADLILTAIAGYALSCVSDQTSLVPKVWEDTAARVTPHTAFLLLVFGVLLAPFTEEIFFRGFMYNAVRRRCAPIIAASLQAFLFAVVHSYELMPSVDIFLSGMILVGIYEWRKTLFAPIFVHGMYNFVALAVLFLVYANSPVLGVYGTTCPEGICIDRIQTGSAAEAAGIRQGDIIVSYNGNPVTNFEQLVRLVRQGRVADTVRIHILRDGTAIDMDVTLRRRP